LSSDFAFSQSNKLIIVSQVIILVLATFLIYISCFLFYVVAANHATGPEYFDGRAMIYVAMAPVARMVLTPEPFTLPVQQWQIEEPHGPISGSVQRQESQADCGA